MKKLVMFWVKVAVIIVIAHALIIAVVGYHYPDYEATLENWVQAFIDGNV